MRTFYDNLHNHSWYREGSAIPLQAPINRGGSKDRPTTSTLSITPQREDDGAKYRCVVWNRAIPEGQTLETTVTLNVNCKYHIFTQYSLHRPTEIFPLDVFFRCDIFEIYYGNFTNKTMESNFDSAVNRLFIQTRLHSREMGRFSNFQFVQTSDSSVICLVKWRNNEFQSSPSGSNEKYLKINNKPTNETSM